MKKLYFSFALAIAIHITSAAFAQSKSIEYLRRVKKGKKKRTPKGEGNKKKSPKDDGKVEKSKKQKQKTKAESKQQKKSTKEKATKKEKDDTSSDDDDGIKRTAPSLAPSPLPTKKKSKKEKATNKEKDNTKSDDDGIKRTAPSLAPSPLPTTKSTDDSFLPGSSYHEITVPTASPTTTDDSLSTQPTIVLSSEKDLSEPPPTDPLPQIVISFSVLSSQNNSMPIYDTSGENNNFTNIVLKLTAQSICKDGEFIVIYNFTFPSSHTEVCGASNIITKGNTADSVSLIDSRFNDENLIDEAFNTNDETILMIGPNGVTEYTKEFFTLSPMKTFLWIKFEIQFDVIHFGQGHNPFYSSDKGYTNHATRNVQFIIQTLINQRITAGTFADGSEEQIHIKAFSVVGEEERVFWQYLSNKQLSAKKYSSEDHLRTLGIFMFLATVIYVTLIFYIANFPHNPNYSQVQPHIKVSDRKKCILRAKTCTRVPQFIEY